jgi:hypothetical protein
MAAGAVLRLALDVLSRGPSAAAEGAVEAALSWSTLLVPARDEGEAILRNRETGRAAVVAFTGDRTLQAWAAREGGTAWRREPAIAVAWRALSAGLEGVLVDPGAGNAGVLLSRGGLRAAVAGRPEREIAAGDNVALRLAAELVQAGDQGPAREAMAEALARGGVLIPVLNGGGQDGDDYALPPPLEGESGERVLFAFTDREALAGATAWAGDTAVVLRGGAAVTAAIEQDYAALIVNARGPGEVRFSRAELEALRERLEQLPVAGVSRAGSTA